MRFYVTVLWIFVLLLAAEVLLEVRAHRNGYLTILFGPGKTAVAAGRGESSGGSWGPTPDFPFRSAIVDAAAPAGTWRVWIASASFGEDAYVEPGAIFPNLLRAELAAGGPTEVMNASRAGYGFVASMKKLRRYGPTYTPDCAVLYHMSLEVNLLSRYLLGGQAEFALGTTGDDVQAPGAEKKDVNGLVRIYESTTTYAVFKEAVGGRLTEQRVLADGLGDEAPALFRERVDEFVATCRELGIQPVLCTFAVGYDETNIDRMPPRVAASVFRYNQHLGLQGWVATVRLLNQVIRAAAADHEVPCIDVGAELLGRDELFRDFVHFNRRGHAEMAGVLARGLRDEDLRPAPEAATGGGQP